MIGIIIICSVLIACLYNWRDKPRLLAGLTVVGVTSADYGIYYLGPYAQIVEGLGYHQYQIVFLLALISILYNVKGRLAFCLMVLYLGLMAINATYYVYELIGVESWPTYLGIEWALFAVQMALLFSMRFTDVCIKFLLESPMVRDIAGSLFDIRRSDLRSPHSTQEGRT